MTSNQSEPAFSELDQPTERTDGTCALPLLEWNTAVASAQ